MAIKVYSGRPRHGKSYNALANVVIPAIKAGRTVVTNLVLIKSEIYADYPDAFALWNLVSSLGAYLSTTSVLVFLVIVTEAFLRKRTAGDNPWGEGATTLEWTLSSPPPVHQFSTLPRID